MKHKVFGGHFGHHHGGGPRGFFRRGFGGGWGPRTRRGGIKFLVLEALLEGPRHGYEIIGAIEQKRGFRPSAGSIYPTLQMLEDGGFVSSADVEGKRVYTITESGRTLLNERADDFDGGEDEPDATDRLRGAAMKLGAAVMSARGSDEATLDRIREILDRARKDVYGVLATDER